MNFRLIRASHGSFQCSGRLRCRPCVATRLGWPRRGAKWAVLRQLSRRRRRAAKSLKAKSTYPSAFLGGSVRLSRVDPASHCSHYPADPSRAIPSDLRLAHPKRNRCNGWRPPKQRLAMSSVASDDRIPACAVKVDVVMNTPFVARCPARATGTSTSVEPRPRGCCDLASHEMAGRSQHVDVADDAEQLAAIVRHDGQRSELVLEHQIDDLG